MTTTQTRSAEAAAARDWSRIARQVAAFVGLSLLLLGLWLAIIWLLVDTWSKSVPIRGSSIAQFPGAVGGLI